MARILAVRVRTIGLYNPLLVVEGDCRSLPSAYCMDYTAVNVLIGARDLSTESSSESCAAAAAARLAAWAARANGWRISRQVKKTGEELQLGDDQTNGKSERGRMGGGRERAAAVAAKMKAMGPGSAI